MLTRSSRAEDSRAGAFLPALVRAHQMVALGDVRRVAGIGPGASEFMSATPTRRWGQPTEPAKPPWVLVRPPRRLGTAVPKSVPHPGSRRN